MTFQTQLNNLRMIVLGESEDSPPKEQTPKKPIGVNLSGKRTNTGRYSGERNFIATKGDPQYLWEKLSG